MERPQDSLGVLGEALRMGGLSPRLRALALKLRGEAAEDQAHEHESASPSFDRLMAEALADFRSWVAVAPEDTDAKIAVSRALNYLGAYDEAIALLEALARVAPERAFDIAIRTGAIYRQQGQYERALRQLDDYAAGAYAAGAGENLGMRFHYHRAWTLMLLHRDREAADEVDVGDRKSVV